MTQLRYLVLDTETTDATPDRGVVEVGWQEIDEAFEVVDSVSSLIDPQRPICPAASAVHGLVQSDVADSPTLEEFFTTNHESCYGKPLEGDVVLVGHNVKFDLETVKAYIPNLHGVICTLRWSRNLYPDAPSHTLGTLAYLLDLPREGETHRVLADVDRTRHLLKHICQTRGVDLRTLYGMSSQPLKVHKMPFGKHKGETIEAVPRSYKRWLLGTDDLDPDLRWTVEQTM